MTTLEELTELTHCLQSRYLRANIIITQREAVPQSPVNTEAGAGAVGWTGTETAARGSPAAGDLASQAIKSRFAAKDERDSRSHA